MRLHHFYENASFFKPLSGVTRWQSARQRLKQKTGIEAYNTPPWVNGYLFFSITIGTFFYFFAQFEEKSLGMGPQKENLRIKKKIDIFAEITFS